MTDATIDPPAKPSGKKGVLLAGLMSLLLGGLGFASTYLELWSPGDLFSGAAARDEAGLPPVVFVDVPVIELNLPGRPQRSLVLAATIETDTENAAAVTHLMPRVQDAFTSFLSGVDRDAYDKRGVLEIIRGELVTRTRYVLGEQPVKDLLITEFRIK
jgi:flagellar FliL protein